MTNLKDYINDLVQEVTEINSQVNSNEITFLDAKDSIEVAVENCMDGVKKLMGIE